jgi:hypothetical protein
MAALVGGGDGLFILAPAIPAALVAGKRRCGSSLVAHIVAFARTFLVICVSGMVYFRFVDSFYGLGYVLLFAISVASSLGAAVIALLLQRYSRWRRKDFGWWIPITGVFLGYWALIFCLMLLAVAASLLAGNLKSASQILWRVLTLDPEFLKLIAISFCTTAVFAVYWLSLRFTKPAEEDK